MEENKYLFIGGSKDGERLFIYSANRIEFPILTSIDQFFEPSFKKESYRRELYKTSTGEYKEDSTGFPGRLEAVYKTFTVFVQNELSFADVTAMLIEGYKKPKE